MIYWNGFIHIIVNIYWNFIIINAATARDDDRRWIERMKNTHRTGRHRQCAVEKLKLQIHFFFSLCSYIVYILIYTKANIAFYTDRTYQKSSFQKYRTYFLSPHSHCTCTLCTPTWCEYAALLVLTAYTRLTKYINTLIYICMYVCIIVYMYA